MNEELMKRLDGYIDANLEPDEIVDLLRTREPGLIADMNKAEKFLFADYSGSTKLKQIKIAYQVKEELIKTRPHDGSAPKKPYTVYKKLYQQGGMTPVQFNEIFALVDRIELERDTEYSKDAKKVVSGWHDFGESNESIVRILKAYSDNRNMVSILYHYSGAGKEEKQTKAVFSKIQTSLIRNKQVPAEAYCLLMAEEKERNDTTIENCVVFHLFLSLLASEETVLVVEPSASFIRKWMQEKTFPRGIKVIFAISDNEARSIFSYSYSERGKFVSTSDIDKILYSEGAPDHTLVFGTRYDRTAELIETLKMFESEQNTVSVFDIDSSFYRTSLHRALCSEEMANRKVWLFPSNIDYCTYPQRKTLFSAVFGSGTKNGNHSSISIESYALLERVTATNDAQCLKKKLLCADMPLASYAEGVSFRKTYEKQEAFSLLKTAKKRKIPVEMELTPEIIQYHTFSVSGGRFAVEAYVREPISTQNRKRGEVVERTKKRTRHRITFEEYDFQVAWIWNKVEYPYAEVKQKNKEIRYIRDEITKVYCPALRGKNITLKTVNYLYPEIESTLPKSDLDRFRKLVNSELGDALVDNLTYEYVKSVAGEVYSEEQEFEIYRSMLALSKVINIAKKYGHTGRNELEKLLEKDRKEKKNLKGIRKNLVKNCLTADEMHIFYRNNVQKILEGKSEYLGLQIRLLTGLESNVVCALRWKDVIKIPGFTFRDHDVYQLCVRRQVQNDGRKILPFEKVQSYRSVPCPMILTDFLLKERERQLSTFGVPEEVLTNMPVVRSNSNMVLAESIDVFPPHELNKLGKNAIKDLGIPEQIISIPDSEKGTIESNLADYQSDLLRSNYGHWARHLGKLDEGEISYLMGRKADITFSVNYCDYENMVSQFQIYIKQNRIASAVFHPNYAAHREKFLFGTGGTQVIRKRTGSTLNRTKRTHTIMDVTVPKGTEEVSTFIKNECGFDITITQIEGD